MGDSGDAPREGASSGTAGDVDLTAEFDALLDGMQTPEALAGLRDAFNASSDELARCAVAFAREERHPDRRNR